MSEKVSRYPMGSLRELWTISFPLMLSMLSTNLMMFADSVILAHYATEAMNAARASFMVWAILAVGFLGIASIAEVFVGRHNGAGDYRKVGSPVWQMIWLSALSIVAFVPLALYGGPWLVPEYHYAEHGLPYFRTLMLFGPVAVLGAALSGFFVGTGRVRWLMVVTILGNLLNIALDVLLVFGWDGYLTPMGTAGAALATGVGQVTQALLLCVGFVRPRMASRYGTLQLSFRWKTFLDCLKIGVPSAVGHMIEVGAWAYLLRMMSWVGGDHLTILVIGQAFYGLVSFSMEGLQKGIIGVTSNIIGSQRLDLIPKVIWSAIRLLGVLGICAAVLYLLYPELLFDQFLAAESAGRRDEIEWMLEWACVGVWVYFLLDGLTWSVAGVLTAAGDTRFIMWMNGIAAWFFGLLPTYLIVIVWEAPPQVVWFVVNVYGLLNALCFYWRYRSGVWRGYIEQQSRT